MASVSTSKDGTRRVLFNDPDGNRRAIHLGKTPAKTCDTVRRMVESLVSAKIANAAPSDEVSRWLGGLPDSLREKLARFGLVEARSAATLGPFLDDYLRMREPTVKPRSLLVYNEARDCLVAHFGADRLLRSLTEADADAFRASLVARGWGPNTVVRRMQCAKMFLKHAVRARIIDRNPFDEIKGSVRANREKFQFVSRETIAKVIGACPNAEWRLIVALSRFAGLRCPSETLALRWGDIDWERGRMRVPSPKTEHHAGHESRIVPIFPELRPYLADAFDAAEPGATHCVARYRSSGALRSAFETILRRASVEPWPRLWHNLRATRQTELSQTFPAHVVCAWLGNSLTIAHEHYLRTTDDDFIKAATVPTGALVERASRDAESDAPDDARDDAESIRTGSHGTRTALDGAMADRPRRAREPEKTGGRSRPCGSTRDATGDTEDIPDTSTGVSCCRAGSRPSRRSCRRAGAAR